MTATEIVLTYPITVGGKEVSTVKLRRPKARDMPLLAEVKGIEDRAGDAGISEEDALRANSLMIRAVTGLSGDDLGEVDLFDDLPRLTEAASDFLESIAPQPQAQESGGN